MANDPEMTQIVEGLESYFKLDNRQYAHLVDGGITDNLGLRAPYEIITVVGGMKSYLKKSGRKIPGHLVMISVDASTTPEPEMDSSRREPSLHETIDVMSDVQLHRYDTDTLELMEKRLTRWARDLSTSGKQVKPYFVQIGIKDVKQPKEFHFLNTIPTSFSLSDEQVDRLIKAGRELLRNNPDYRRFLASLGGASTTGNHVASRFRRLGANR